MLAVPWGHWAWARPGDILTGMWILCDNPASSNTSALPTAPFSPTHPSTSREFGMVPKDDRALAFPWLCRDAAISSSLLISLEKVVSHPSLVLFVLVSRPFCTFLHAPSSSASSPLPQLPPPRPLSPSPQARCAFKFCWWKRSLRLDPRSIFYT